MSTKLTTKGILKFVIPSLLGILLFLTPVPVDGGLSIAITVILAKVSELIGATILEWAAFFFILGGAVLTIIGSVFKPKFFMDHEVLRATFVTQWYWALIRGLSGVIVIPVFFNFGPEWLISPDTGNFVLFGLISGILPIGFICPALINLLLEFGLMEFIGTFCSKVFKRLFKIPGRAAIDCITSFVGDTAVGTIMTNNQYMNGLYTGREAAVIMTTFTSVSITFMLVIIGQVGLPHMFFPFLLTVFLTDVILAVIMPRIPPLCRKKDEYYNGICNFDESLHPEGVSLPKWALVQAINKAENNDLTFKKFSVDYGKNLCMICFTLNSLVMTIGTAALIVAYYTPIFTWLGTPFVPLLNLLQVPEAETVASTLLGGFADMFIPSAIGGAQLTSVFSKMLIAVISICQVIFISETGNMILSTKAPVTFVDLIVIFLERTILILLIATLIIRFVLGIPMV